MNYPVWELSTYGGGFLVALIATIHVYIAHFAVGGGLFLVVTEMKARREGNGPMLEYVQGHTRFFLLVTMVLGALTGVGIWSVISVLNPAATSILIHTFVFGWATEWVFFIVEILSLLVYTYTFRSMDPKKHIHVGWIYFIAAWLSLFLIDGIISFMLTPGRWLENGNFWSGFFNPTFPPSLIFRTAFALVLAGVYGLITSTRIKDEALSKKMTRYCVIWLVIPFALLIPSGFWYLYAVPSQAREMILGGSPETVYFAKYLLGISPVVILGGLVMILRLSRPLQRTLTLLVLIIAFLYMGAFEMVRESSRRPYIIYGHMYANGILKSSLTRVREQGVLAAARWVTHRDATASNRMEAGRELFRVLCISCHSVGGPRNDILVRTRDMGPDDIQAVMSEMGDEKPFMPPFPGSEGEKEILASYITERIMKRE